MARKGRRRVHGIARRTLGTVYLLWAKGTSCFKVGFTAGPVERRIADLQTGCPFELRPIGAIPGTGDDEATLQWGLREFQMHGEWFALPEAVVWELLRHFKVPGAEAVSHG